MAARRGRGHRVRRFFTALLVLILLFAALYADSNLRLVTDEFTVESELIPTGFDGFRIVQLSDMHSIYYGDANEWLIKKVSEAEPDIIAITGDIIDGAKDSTEEKMDFEREYVRVTITALCEIAPVYYVSGNHEWESPWRDELFELIEECGATVMHNDYVALTAGNGDTVILAGIEDPNGPADMLTPEEFIGEIMDAEGDPYIIALYHRNDKLSLWAELGIDVVLSGHAHGGMIRLPYIGGLVGPGKVLFPEYDAGMYTEGGTTMLVSRGIGGPRLRLFNNPEIVLLTLKTEG